MPAGAFCATFGWMRTSELLKNHWNQSVSNEFVQMQTLLPIRMLLLASVAFCLVSSTFPLEWLFCASSLQVCVCVLPSTDIIDFKRICKSALAYYKSRRIRAKTKRVHMSCKLAELATTTTTTTNVLWPTSDCCIISGAIMDPIIQQRPKIRMKRADEVVILFHEPEQSCWYWSWCLQSFDANTLDQWSLLAHTTGRQKCML